MSKSTVMSVLLIRGILSNRKQYFRFLLDGNRKFCSFLLDGQSKNVSLQGLKNRRPICQKIVLSYVNKYFYYFLLDLQKCMFVL